MIHPFPPRFPRQRVDLSKSGASAGCGIIFDYFRFTEEDYSITLLPSSFIPSNIILESHANMEWNRREGNGDVPRI